MWSGVHSKSKFTIYIYVFLCVCDNVFEIKKNQALPCHITYLHSSIIKIGAGLNFEGGFPLLFPPPFSFSFSSHGLQFVKGSTHSAFLSTTGKLYTCGSNGEGRWGMNWSIPHYVF